MGPLFVTWKQLNPNEQNYGKSLFVPTLQRASEGWGLHCV